MLGLRIQIPDLKGYDMMPPSSASFSMDFVSPDKGYQLLCLCLLNIVSQLPTPIRHAAYVLFRLVYMSFGPR